MTSEATPGEAAGEPARRVRLGLSGKLLLLTILFVMLAEVLIYLPSIANFRRNWLNDRLAAAQIAALVLDAAPAGAVPRDLERRLLDEIGAFMMATRSGGARRLLAVNDMPPTVAADIDLRDSSPVTQMMDALGTLLASGQRYIRVTGEGMGGFEFIEIVIDEAPLKRRMIEFSGNILLLSLLISGITAGLVYVALHWLIVRPVRRLSDSIQSFAADPEDATRILEPSDRGDEVGAAEVAVARMERELSRELREKKHLAALGLAVSKINHDLRNMLASAQLISDRLVSVNDPLAQRFTPKLIAALDRAIGYSQSILDYGKASEREPKRRLAPLAPLLDELRDALGLGNDGAVRFSVTVPEGLVVDADTEQLYRVLLNLGRNALAALRAREEGEPGRITIEARRDGERVLIDVADDGPGVPAVARANLFEAFRGSTTAGGSGLGLAIAAEIVRLHGGSIMLVEVERGARFRTVWPDR